MLGCDMLRDNDRMMQLAGSIGVVQNIVATCIKIDAPDDLEQFRQFVHNHFMQYRKCRSTIVRICPTNYFFQEITDKSITDKITELHTEKLDDDEVHEFLSKCLLQWHECEQGQPLIKIWIVPGKDEGTAYIGIKSYH